ncbi:MAG: ABC transporter permease [Anaerolineae bacterium]|nr:ABC transporter permease [Anaerolineae bacterium]
MSLFKTWAVLVKEGRHIWRDPSTLILLLLAPVFLMIIMSYALIANIRETPIMVMDKSRSALSREFLDTLANSKDIVVNKLATNYAEAERYFDRSQTKALVVIPPNFASQLTAGQPAEVQVIVDGTDPSTANHVINHVLSRAQVFGVQIAIKSIERTNPELIRYLQTPLGIDLRIRTWYNPDLKNTHGIVPAMIVLVMSLPAMVVMNALVREKEYSTLESIFATPLSRSELLVGKLLPYVFTGLISVVICTIVAVKLFGVPFQGSFLLFLVLSVDFLLATYAMGIFMATFVSSQAASSIIALLVFMFPGFFLSGIFYPVSSFPDLVQEEAQWLPSTQFVAITRGLLVKGQGLEALWYPAVMLLVIALMMTVLAVFFFKKKLK